MLGCLNPEFRRRGMRAKLTISRCSEGTHIDEDYYNEYEVIADYDAIEHNELQPRGFSKKKKWPKLCIKKHQDNTPSSENEMQKTNNSRPPCVEEPSQLIILNTIENPPGPLLSPEEPRSLDDIYSTSSQESSDAFPAEEGPSAMPGQRFQGVSLSGNSSIVHEEADNNENSLEPATNPSPALAALRMYKPTQEVVIDQENSMQQEKEKNSPPLEKMERFFEVHVTTVPPKELIDGKDFTENVNLNAEKPSFKMDDDLLNLHTENLGSRFPEKVSSEKLNTTQKGNISTLTPDAAAVPKRMVFEDGNIFGNMSGTSSPLDDLQSKPIIYSKSLETQSINLSTLKTSPGAEDIALQNYSATAHALNSYLSHKATLHENVSFISREALQTEKTATTSQVGTSFTIMENQGTSEPLKEDFLLVDGVAQTVSPDQGSSSRPLRKGFQSRKIETTPQLSLDTVTRNPTAFSVLNGYSSLFAKNNGTAESDKLTDNPKVTNKAVYTNDVLDSNEISSLNPFHAAQETNDLTLKESFPKAGQGKGQSGRENGFLARFDVVHKRKNIPTSQGILDISGQQNFIQDSLLENTTTSLPKVNLSEENEVFLYRSLPPSQRVNLGNYRNSKVLVKLKMESNLEKRSLKSRQATSEETDGVAAEVANNLGKMEGRTQVLLNGSSINLSNKLKISLQMTHLRDENEAGNHGATSPDKTSLSPPLSSSIQYSTAPYYLSSSNLQAERVQRVTQNGSPQRVDTITIPSYSRTKTGLEDNDTETKVGLTLPTSVGGQTTNTSFAPQKTNRQMNEAGVPETLEAPAMVHADPQIDLQLQLRESSIDQEAFNSEGDIAPSDGTIKTFKWNEQKEAVGNPMQKFLRGESRVPGHIHVETSMKPSGLDKSEVTDSLRPLKQTPAYDDYSVPEESQEFDIYGEVDQDPRTFAGKVRQYYIAAEEVMWDYGSQISSPYLRDK